MGGTRPEDHADLHTGGSAARAAVAEGGVRARRFPARPGARWVPLTAGAISFALYAVLAPRSIGPGDAAELSLALALAGVPHPSGYPLYTLAGHLFVRAAHAIGIDWGHAANMWSALGAAVAVALFAALSVRLSAPRRSARIAIASAIILFAAHPAWLGAAMVAEVHSWGVALALALGLAGLLLLRRLESKAPTGQVGLAQAAVWGLLCGAALAHQLISLAFVVPLTLALLWRSWRCGAMRPLPVMLCALVALVPLASYGWIGWRGSHPAAYQWPLLGPGLADLFDHLRGAVYVRAYVGGFMPSPDERGVIVRDLMPFLAAGLAGLLAALPRVGPARRAWAVAVIAGSALSAAFILYYAVPDPSAYLLPMLAFALLALPLLGSRVRLFRLPPVLAALVVSTAALLLVWLPRAWREGGRIEAEAAAIRTAWLALEKPAAIVLWDEDRYAELRLHQILRGEHPGVVVDNPSSLTWERPRRAFERRAGIDPLAGLELRGPEDVRWIPLNIQRQTQRPVVVFEPRRP
jgi:hypothetical protein